MKRNNKNDGDDNNTPSRSKNELTVLLIPERPREGEHSWDWQQLLPFVLLVLPPLPLCLL